MDTKRIEKIVEKANSLLEEFVFAAFGENGVEGKKLVMKWETITVESHNKKESNKERTSNNITVQQGNNVTSNNININNNINNNNNNNKCNRNNPCNHCSKCTLTPCTPDEIWEIAVLLHIPEREVVKKHTAIMDLISTGEFKTMYKKHKTVFYTLKRWLEMALERGYLQELDPDNYSILLENSPEKKAAHERFIKKAKLLGVL